MIRTLALLLPLPAAALLAQAVVEPLADGAARWLDAGVAPLLANTAGEPAQVFVEPVPGAEAFKVSTHETARGGQASVPARSAVRSAVPRAQIPRHGIRVSRQRVLALANAGARPSGIFVPARGARPPGLALVGVGGLGVGLRDGDVLTHAGGRPATSVSAVIGVVIGSRARHASEISGRFWRNGEPWNLIVEQPYVRKRRPSADTGSSAGPGPERAVAADPGAKPAARVSNSQPPAARRGS